MSIESQWMAEFSVQPGAAMGCLCVGSAPTPEGVGLQRFLRLTLLIAATTVVAASCGGGTGHTSETPVSDTIESTNPVPSANEEEPATSLAPIVLADPESVFDPVREGEQLPDGYRRVFFRDQIAPVYEPIFTAASDVDWPLDSLVLGVAGAETAKAYPVAHLTKREMVIDTLDGTPILVSWCPLCATGMVHSRELNGTVIVFGNQGDLWGNAMTWWDHDTGSVWSQPLGEAILGARKGAQLDLLPSTLTTWQAWLSAHPQTLALDVSAWYSSFHLEDMAIVLDLGTEAVAYEISDLQSVGVINDIVAGIEIAVVVDPNDAALWAVFSRKLDSSVAELELTSEGLLDSVSGTVFHPYLGVGRSGPLANQVLNKLPASTSFSEDFLTFFPDGRIWSADSQ